MRFAIVGCGFVADSYLATLKNYPDLELLGVYDRDSERCQRFAEYHGLQRYASYDQLLADDRVELVANLTNPDSHYEVSRRALDANRHVYSEKPLATSLADAEKLVALAEARQRLLASAPCSLLGETAQTLWKGLRDGCIGIPRLVYAELDIGDVSRQRTDTWFSESGKQWPTKDEFEVGTTSEHAGYYLTWLTAFFGPVRRVTAFAHVLQPERGIALSKITPDYATASLEFASGVIGRLTSSMYPPRNLSLRIFGDAGTIGVDHAWESYGTPVVLNRYHRRQRLSYWVLKYPVATTLLGFGPRRLPLVQIPETSNKVFATHPVDFCRGIAELAAAARERRTPRMQARWALHVTELTLAMQNPAELGTPRNILSEFAPINPMPWAG